MSAAQKVELRVAGILVKKGEVLLVKHRRESAEYWVLPGGRVEYGETLCQALVREFHEELSMEVQPGKLSFMNDAAPSDGVRHIVNVYFNVSSDDKLDTNKLKDVEDACYFGPDGLDGIDLRPPVADTLRKVIACGETDLHYLGNLWQ